MSKEKTLAVILAGAIEAGCATGAGLQKDATNLLDGAANMIRPTATQTAPQQPAPVSTTVVVQPAAQAKPAPTTTPAADPNAPAPEGVGTKIKQAACNQESVAGAAVKGGGLVLVTDLVTDFLGKDSRVVKTGVGAGVAAGGQMIENEVCP